MTRWPGSCWAIQISCGTRNFTYRPALSLRAAATSNGCWPALDFPPRLDGLSVLDIGTTNGAAAFLAEQRGAARVVATDILPATWFGFEQLASRARLEG